MTPRELAWQKTEARQKDLRALIELKFTASRMCTTKWAKVAACIDGICVDTRVKFVDIENKVFALGSFWHVTRDWFDSGGVSVFTSNSIEWLEIVPIQEVRQGFLIAPKKIDHSADIEKRLRSASVPYHWQNGAIRIVGHVRKEASEQADLPVVYLR